MSPPILLLAGIPLAVALAGEFVGAALLDNSSKSGRRLTAARNDPDALVSGRLV